MIKIERKIQNLSRLEQLLLAYPDGLKQAEIARRLGIHRSTVGRYLTDMTGILPIYEEDGLIKIDRDSYLNNVKLTVHEIMVLHLATRLFSSRTDKPSPHACSAVRKLGNCLKPYSERLSGFLLTTASGIERRVSSQDNQYVSVLEKLTRAWSDGVWVKLDYFSKKSGEIHCYHFAPWFIQPYPAGFTVYVIGFCREKNHRITLKVERIRDVELLKEQYDIPDSFNPEELFQDAWGIWYGDGDPVDVILKFSSGVADRVTETIWHKSQEIVRAATGEVTFRASVAEPLEMVPWIRGWGSDCEVIAPRNLRDFMREEIRKLEGLYSDRPTIQREGLGG